MMAQKRNFEFLQDVKEATNAEVHFGVELLSPLKKSKSGYDYYNAQVNDGTKAIRLVGFDGDSHEKLIEFVDKKTPVKATNCAVKKSRMNSEELEIHIGKATTFTPSQRRLEFKSTEQQLEVNTLIQLLSLDDGVRVNVKSKVQGSS